MHSIANANYFYCTKYVITEDISEMKSMTDLRGKRRKESDFNVVFEFVFNLQRAGTTENTDSELLAITWTAH